MANISLEINDNHVPRIKDAFIALLVEGDALDLENPTNQEVVVKLKAYLTDRIRRVVLNYEKNINQEEFVFTELDIS